MTAIENFHFIRPGWLLLLPVILWLWWQQRRQQDPLGGWRAVIDDDLLTALTVGRDSGKDWRSAGLLAGWLLAAIAIAGPTWRPEPSPFADDPVPVMLVLRAGASMDVSDIPPSRMERARLKVSDFADERKGQPLGLIAYAGSAHLVLPPTRDTSVVASMASEISPPVMPNDGDDLPGALDLAAKTLGPSGGSIVVVTDDVTPDSTSRLAEFRSTSPLPVHFLAVARDETPEWQALQRAADDVDGDATLMTPDTTDIHSLVTATARAPVSVAAAGQGTHWAESGWWLVPLLVLLSLAGFRRTSTISGGESDA